MRTAPAVDVEQAWADRAKVIRASIRLKHSTAAMLEYGLPPLAAKLTSDTKIDLIKRKGLSASQENLSAALGVPAAKVHMSNADWRTANRLTKKGLALTHKRVVGDVLQHMQLRRALIERGLLGPARMWRPYTQ